MSKLFHARLIGLESHYMQIIDALKNIKKRAKAIARRPDYDDLPSQCISYDAEGGDAISVSQDIFMILDKTYKSYREFAMAHFAEAAQSSHLETLTDIFEISESFDDLSRFSIRCEIDVLARLWFYDIWQKTASSFEDFEGESEDREYFEYSNFKHLAYTSKATIKMLEEHFGYLAR